MLLAQRGMTIMCFYDNRKEGSNVYCYGISNNYIASRGGTFSNSGNAIIFNTACESLKGNYNLVNTYLNKGAGLYIGYNDINWCGRIQGAYFFYYLLNGMSVQKAINNVRTTIYSQEPNNRKKEIVDQKKVFGAYNRSVKEARMLSIIHTKMGEIKDESNDEGIKIKINGSVKLLTPHDVDHTYGFYLSEKNDFESGVMLPGFKLGSSGCRVTDGHTVELEQTLTKKELEKGKVYYVCPYLYDGESYCLAEKLEPLYVNGVETSAPEYAKGDIALLCGQFVNGKPVQEAGFRLGYDSDYNQYTDFHWDKAVGQTSATFNLSVYGLHPSMTYYYKAYIKVDGEYYYGNTISFNTDEVIDGSITNYVPQNATYVVDDDGEYVKFDFNMTYTAPPMFETTTQWGLYIANLDNTEKTYVWPATKLKISGESQNLTLYVKKSDFDQKNFSTFQATKRLKMGVYKCVKYGSDTQYYFFSPSQDVNLVYEQKPSLTFNTAYYGATKAVSQNGEEKWQTPIWGTYTVNGSFWLDKIDLVVILGNADDNVGTWKIEGDGKHDFEIYYTYSKNQSLNTAFRFDMILSNGSKVSSTNAIKITGSDKVANVSIISTTRSADSTRGGHTGRGVLKMKSFSTKPISNSGQHNERKVNERTLIAIERNNR